jgi:hypothetical protein
VDTLLSRATSQEGGEGGEGGEGDGAQALAYFEVRLPLTLTLTLTLTTDLSH